MFKKNLKGLLVKDLILSRRNFYTPYWISVGIYLLTGFLVLTATIKGNFHLSDLQKAMELKTEFANIEQLVYLLNIGLSAFSSLMFIITSVYLGQQALNDEYNNRCELFYRTLPISDWEFMLSKYIVAVGGSFLSFLLLAFANAIICNSIYAYYLPFSFDAAFKGIMQPYLSVFFGTAFLTAFGVFASAVFRKKAGSKMIGVIFLTHIVIKEVNYLFNVNFPNPITMIFGKVFDHFGAAFNHFSIGAGTKIPFNWLAVFNTQTIFLLLGTVIFLVAGVYIYHYREVR